MSGEGNTLQNSQHAETEEGLDELFNVFMSITRGDTPTSHLSVTLRSSKSSGPENDDNRPRLFSEEITENSDEGDLEESDSDSHLRLIDLLREENCDVKEIAEGWTSKYHSCRDEALNAMLELMLNSAGVSEPDAIIAALDRGTTTEAYDSCVEAETLPAILDDEICELILKFLKLTLSDRVCLLDNLMMTRIRFLMSLMTTSIYGSSRYAGLLIAALITFEYMQYLTQLNSEPQATGYENNISDNKAMAKEFFDIYIQIVLRSQRDAGCYVIRKLAYQIYFSWFDMRIQMLMKDFYLRHILWAMHDDSCHIRKLAVETCGRLYNYDYVVSNTTFIWKTLTALEKRTQDVSPRVAAASLDILCDLQRCRPFLLRDINKNRLYLLCFRDRWRGSKAAMFLHEMLSDMTDSTTEFLLHTVMFLEESKSCLPEKYNMDSAVKVFVENLFPHSHRELTNWAAWHLLMLGKSLDGWDAGQELAGYLLVEVINFISQRADNRYFLKAGFPLPPGLSKKRKESCSVDKKKETMCSEYLVNLTHKFGPHLINLWEKFKENPCLTRLLQIPRYFNGSIESLDVKQIFCYLVYISKISSTTMKLEAVHQSLGCLYHLAFTSPRWKQAIPKMENIIFKDVTVKFMKVCTKLATQELKKNVELGCVRVLKQAFFVSKCFDVSNTSLLLDAPYALKLGVAKRNVEIIYATLMICFYTIQWQLRKICDNDLPENEKTAVLHKILSLSRTLMSQLQYLIKIQNTLIRETAFFLTCKMLAIFSPCNTVTAPFELLHLPPPTLEVSEWLNYNLICQTPQDHIPEGIAKFDIATESLQVFCLALEIQALNIYYYFSVLVYFKFYEYPKNYNCVLKKNFLTMARMQEFPYYLIEMFIWMKANTEHNVETIARGLCTVGFENLLTEKSALRLAREVVGFGLSQIINQSLHFLFRILTPFVKYLHWRDVETFDSIVRRVFQKYVEEDDLKWFLKSCAHYKTPMKPKTKAKISRKQDLRHE